MKELTVKIKYSTKQSHMLDLIVSIEGVKNCDKYEFEYLAKLGLSRTFKSTFDLTWVFDFQNKKEIGRAHV